MGEKQGPGEQSFNNKAKKQGFLDRMFPYDPEKRETVKRLGKAAIAVAGVALSAEYLSSEGYKNDVEREKEIKKKINDMIHGYTENKVVKQGDSLQEYWKESGYNKDTYFDHWMEAVKQLNPGRKFDENDTIYPPEGIIIPIMKGKGE